MMVMVQKGVQDVPLQQPALPALEVLEVLDAVVLPAVEERMVPMVLTAATRTAAVMELMARTFTPNEL